MQQDNSKMENIIQWDNFYIVSNAIARNNVIAKNGFPRDNSHSQKELP